MFLAVYWGWRKRLSPLHQATLDFYAMGTTCFCIGLFSLALGALLQNAFISVFGAGSFMLAFPFMGLGNLLLFAALMSWSIKKAKKPKMV